MKDGYIEALSQSRVLLTSQPTAVRNTCLPHAPIYHHTYAHLIGHLTNTDRRTEASEQQTNQPTNQPTSQPSNPISVWTLAPHPRCSGTLPRARTAPPPLETGTSNEEPGLSSDGAGLGNRLTVHSVRDTQGRVLGLGPQRGIAGAGGNGGDDDGEVAGGWEPAIEAWTSHEGTVTGIDVVSGGYGTFGGGCARVLTSGGDG